MRHSLRALTLALVVALGGGHVALAALCASDDDPGATLLLPYFEVDVQRRWPSVEKAKRLLGWEARIGVERGIAETVDWLRERDLAA